MPLLIIAKPIEGPTECKNNNWIEIIVTKYGKITTESSLFCLLPNGEYYEFNQLKNDHKKYSFLVSQYSGKKPSFKQITKTKEDLIKRGYGVFFKI